MASTHPVFHPRLLASLSMLLGLALSQAEPAWAGAFSVLPIQVRLSSRAPSALVTLRSQSAEPLRFQLSVFVWDQSPHGEMQLTPTEDIVFFPSLLTLAPGEARQVRIGAATPAVATEKTYRIFVEELPPFEASNPASQIRVLTRMGIPIFLEPVKLVPGGRIEAMACSHGQVSFQVKNMGNVHFVVQSVRLNGLNAAGASLFDRQLAGWYVLAGGSQVYELQLPTEDCSKIKALAVEVQTEQDTFKDRYELPPGACCE